MDTSRVAADSAGVSSTQSDASLQDKSTMADASLLTAAFLKGAGLPAAAVPSGLTPELMEVVGQLLKTSIANTLALSKLRAMVKREVNAEVTMVVVRNNNPLKFFSDSETVLTQMLRKKMPGFMSPIEAMDDAHEDIKIHQLALMAGMREEMRALIESLNPAVLEKDVPVRPLIDAVQPSARKARAWDKFHEVFADIKRKHEGDSQTVFGKAFLDAYEKETERVKNAATKE
ncbi:type VI secretion system-associated FHA domain protein TagH [Noviherbaspirillum sp.]|uniref:type VI secretion system-associated FHA domain protein TagH n=1 Tax=Noviherbaspirillum sp. TaxID=1926288 RepID=UPI002B470FCE|nr:type VI secretion system-associated FHA domain protein TagH [Noviherbaspirillum sp.]HJV81946.1 type VI secretion system-associated FHA domain protein TagH [Noviherbaspirillum sp.]